jgi:hypothetical protein
MPGTPRKAGSLARWNQQVLSRLARDRGVDIAYAGADEKRALAAALAGDGAIPPDVIEFALFDPEGCGRSTGTNRNAQLLYGAGQLFVSVDGLTRGASRYLIDRLRARQTPLRTHSVHNRR